MGYSRIVLLDDERKLIVGRDLDNIFEAGVIYSIEKIAGQIVFKELGEMCLPTDDEEAIKIGMSPLGGHYQYVLSQGFCFITKEEYEKNKNLSQG